MQQNGNFEKTVAGTSDTGIHSGIRLNFTNKYSYANFESKVHKDEHTHDLSEEGSSIDIEATNETQVAEDHSSFESDVHMELETNLDYI